MTSFVREKGSTIVQRIGPRDGSAGDLLGRLPGGGAENKRVRVELFESVQNLFNDVNPIGYSGVMTSPFSSPRRRCPDGGSTWEYGSGCDRQRAKRLWIRDDCPSRVRAIDEQEIRQRQQ